MKLLENIFIFFGRDSAKKAYHNIFGTGYSRGHLMGHWLIDCFYKWLNDSTIISLHWVNIISIFYHILLQLALMRHTNGKIRLLLSILWKISIEPHFGRFDWFLWNSIRLSFILFMNSWCDDATILLDRASQLKYARCNRCSAMMPSNLLNALVQNYHFSAIICYGNDFDGFQFAHFAYSQHSYHVHIIRSCEKCSNCTINNKMPDNDFRLCLKCECGQINSAYRMNAIAVTGHWANNSWIAIDFRKQSVR